MFRISSIKIQARLGSSMPCFLNAWAFKWSSCGSTVQLGAARANQLPTIPQDCLKQTQGTCSLQRCSVFKMLWRYDTTRLHMIATLFLHHHYCYHHGPMGFTPASAKPMASPSIDPLAETRIRLSLAMLTLEGLTLTAEGKWHWLALKGKFVRRLEIHHGKIRDSVCSGSLVSSVLHSFLFVFLGANCAWSLMPKCWSKSSTWSSGGSWRIIMDHSEKKCHKSKIIRCTTEFVSPVGTCSRGSRLHQWQWHWAR